MRAANLIFAFVLTFALAVQSVFAAANDRRTGTEIVICATDGLQTIIIDATGEEIPGAMHACAECCLVAVDHFALETASISRKVEPAAQPLLPQQITGIRTPMPRPYGQAPPELV